MSNSSNQTTSHQSPSNASNQSSIADLAAGMQQITQSGAGKDTKLVASDCQAFLTAINNCQATLKDLRTQTATLANYGSVGKNLPDAEGVRSQLIFTTDEFLTGTDKVNNWLDELRNGINAAITRFNAADQNT